MIGSKKRNEDPAEGSRETVERELARSGNEGGKDGKRPGTRQQVSSKTANEGKGKRGESKSR